MAPAPARWDPRAAGLGPQHAAGLGLSCSASCPSSGEEGEREHPKHASTRGLGGQTGVWDSPAQQPLIFWDPVLGVDGVCVGERGP